MVIASHLNACLSAVTCSDNAKGAPTSTEADGQVDSAWPAIWTHRLFAAAHYRNVTSAPTATSRTVASTRMEADTLVDLPILVSSRQSALAACEPRNRRMDTRRWKCSRPQTILLRATRPLARLAFAAPRRLLKGFFRGARSRKRSTATL
jgi:hypothetical protein